MRRWYVLREGAGKPVDSDGDDFAIVALNICSEWRESRLIRTAETLRELSRNAVGIIQGKAG